MTNETPSDAAVPSPSVEEARDAITRYAHLGRGAVLQDNLDALVAAVRREEQQEAEARVQGIGAMADEWSRLTWGPYANPGLILRRALAAPGTPDSAGETGQEKP